MGNVTFGKKKKGEEKNERPAMLHVSERQKLHACMRALLCATGLRFKNSLSPPRGNAQKR